MNPASLILANGGCVLNFFREDLLLRRGEQFANGVAECFGCVEFVGAEAHAAIGAQLALDDFFGVRECLVIILQCHVNLGAGAEVGKAVGRRLGKFAAFRIDCIRIERRCEREDLVLAFVVGGAARARQEEPTRRDP